MSTQTVEKPVSEMSSKELEQLYLSRKKAEKRKRDKERKAYIEDRDANILEAIEAAEELAELLKYFKEGLAELMVKQHEKLASYGDIRSNSKGGFSITNADGDMRIVRRRDTEPTWDERAEKGVLLLKDFLGDVVKKRDVKTYDLLMGFMIRNENGDLEHSRVMELLKHDDFSTDNRWVEGIKLVKEGYSNVMKGYGYQLLHRPAEGDKWQNINLSFSSL
jgi:hypothetical protein